MMTAKLFENGRSQAVRLPKECRFSGDEVSVSKVGDAVILLPALWSVRDAEHFALGGVHLLTGLGCDALSFGAETADLPLLQAAVDALESPDLPAVIQPHLYAGLP